VDTKELAEDKLSRAKPKPVETGDD
jgi:hypothetical protein